MMSAQVLNDGDATSKRDEGGSCLVGAERSCGGKFKTVAPPFRVNSELVRAPEKARGCGGVPRLLLFHDLVVLS